MSVLQGGKFGHGFLAAGVAQAFAKGIDGLSKARFSLKRIAAAALVGGTVSKLTGGKFANGAQTGAFSRMFNDEAHFQNNKKMMSDLKQYVDSGDYVGFWEAAKEYGDPLAELALKFHGSLYGDTFGNRVAISKLELSFNNGERMSQTDLASLKAIVGRGVIETHYDALRVDINLNIGTPRVLSVEQVDSYHYSYFSSINLNRNTYGGNLMSMLPASVRRFAYCQGCDPVAPAN